ncbi:MAG TPA: alpha/beta fold hydrolase [Bacillota bacterium]|nr:alpha/beta fold hydrolase [Bacillota bacterium]
MSEKLNINSAAREAAPVGAERYQTIGVTGNLPVFYQQLKEKLTFPLAWTAGNFPDFNAWRQTARKKVLEKLPDPDQTPFDVQVIAEQDHGTYLARKVVFNLTAESRVLGMMLVPKGKGPFPAALLLHDHGAEFGIGKEKVIKPWGDDPQLTTAQSWVARYFSGRFIGNELAARGYLVLAIDALGWGGRGGLDYETQQALASNLQALGLSLAGWIALEDLRTAEFLASLPEVDSKRIAAIGLSMGAQRAWQIAALSDRIAAGIAVCWMGTIKGLLNPENNLVRGQSAFCMTHPGLMQDLDYPDIASIAAPKPMLFYNGAVDYLFPANVVQEAYAKLRQVWQSQQVEAKLITKIWPDLGHIFSKEMQDEAFEWLDCQFQVASK